MEKYSLSDIGALMGNSRDGFLEGNGIIILILFFLIFGFGGGAWGNNNAVQGALTRADLCEGFNFQNLENGVRGIQNGLCDGFYAQNTTMLQGFNGLGMQVAENRFASQSCCCETNRNIDAVRYDASQNTCRITTNADQNTQKILDKLCTMESNAKDQRIADLTANLQTANFQLSQQAQSINLISTLQPTPKPAYVVGSPFGNYGYSYGCGYCNQ